MIYVLEKSRTDIKLLLFGIACVKLPDNVQAPEVDRSDSNATIAALNDAISALQAKSNEEITQDNEASLDRNSQATIAALTEKVSDIENDKTQKNEGSGTTQASAPNNSVMVAPTTPTPVVNYIVVTPTPEISSLDKLNPFKEQESVIDLIFKGSEEFFNNDDARAVQTLSEALSKELVRAKQSPEFLLEIYFFRGWSYEGLDRYEDAISDYSLAIDLLRANPYIINEYYVFSRELHEFLERRAKVYQFRLDEYQLAMKDLNEILVIEPGLPSAQAALGILYVELEQYSVGLAEIEKALMYDAIIDDPAYVYYSKGEAHYSLARSSSDASDSDYEMALEAFLIADNLWNEDSTLFRYAIKDRIGWSYYRLNRLTEAESVFVEIPQSAGDFYKSAVNGLAGTYSEQGRYDFAIQKYDELIRLDPFFSGYPGNRALMHEQMGDWSAALKDYDLAIELGSDHAPFYFNRGLILDRRLNESSEGLKDYEKACRLDRYYCDKY